MSDDEAFLETDADASDASGPAAAALLDFSVAFNDTYGPALQATAAFITGPFRTVFSAMESGISIIADVFSGGVDLGDALIPTFPGWPTAITEFPGWPDIAGMWGGWPNVTKLFPGWPDLMSLFPGWPDLSFPGWPDLPSFSWPSLPDFSWPSIPDINWGTFIDPVDLSDFVSGVNPFQNRDNKDNNDGLFGLGIGPFAQGGIVRSRGIAEVGEAGPEAVMPLDDLSREISRAIRQAQSGDSGDRQDMQGVRQDLQTLVDEMQRLRSDLQNLTVTAETDTSERRDPFN